jgi:putative transposase
MCPTSTCAAVATDLKTIYSASTENEAEFNLELKARERGCALPQHKPGRGGSTGLASSRYLPSQKTFGIRDLHHECHPVGEYDAAASVTRNHRIFPSDEAVYKVVYLAMRNLAVARGRCPSATGSQRSIGLPSSLRGGFRDERAGR